MNVVAIRPGIKVQGNAPLTVNGVTVSDCRRHAVFDYWLQLSFDAQGTDEALVRSGLVTADEMASLPPWMSGRHRTRRFRRDHPGTGGRWGTPAGTVVILKRRKLYVLVHVCLYGSDNPQLREMLNLCGLSHSSRPPVLRVVK